ncbi:SWP12 [Hepatospora eriocheir]|uniref:SWP12 n=1 Tax=Hepatospora eriocheir TaxID=1081669 RepID=A0A1X0QBB8_9MICR|nr:SWP12 [Hepatospora eriocheir]
MDFTKDFVNRLDKIKNSDIKFVEGYENVEKEYLKIRDYLIRLKDCLHAFKHYEHGGKTVKNIKKIFKYVQDKSRVKFLKDFDCYSRIAYLFEKRARRMTRETNKDLRNDLSGIFYDVSISKTEFNELIKNLIKELDKLISFTYTIDGYRKANLEAIYSLDNLYHMKGYRDELIRIEHKNFDIDCRGTLKQMMIFNTTPEIPEILNKFLKEHQKHTKYIFDRIQTVIK